MDASPPGGNQEAKPADRSRTLIIRVIVGIVLIPLVLVVNHVGGIVFAACVALFAAVGCREFNIMFGDVIPERTRLIGMLGSACICLAFHFGSIAGGALAVTLLLIVILVDGLSRQDRESFALSASLSFTGLVYTGWLFGFFVLLRDISHGPAAGLAGRDYVLMVLILTWSYDSLAYFGGSFLGRTRMFTRISPSKTVEGTLIGLAGGVAAAIVCKMTFAAYFGWVQAVVIGLLMGVAAQTGDLVESMFKRSARTKDSSHLIPGHGGVLDRTDSLLLTGPVFYLYVRALAAWAWL